MANNAAREILAQDDRLFQAIFLITILLYLTPKVSRFRIPERQWPHFNIATAIVLAASMMLAGAVSILWFFR